jgi:hypothetical protein
MRHAVVHAWHILALIFFVKSSYAECCYSFDHEKAETETPCCLKTDQTLGKQACSDYIAKAAADGIVYMGWISGECPTTAKAAASLYEKQGLSYRDSFSTRCDCMQHK